MENTKKLYRSIGRVWCPRLNDFISFNDAGFRHLVRKRGIMLPKSEQKRRFALLPYAKSIIENPNAVISHEGKQAELSPADWK